MAKWKYLVILESKAKAEKVQHFLGEKYKPPCMVLL